MYNIDGSMLYQRVKADNKDQSDWVAHADCPVRNLCVIHTTIILRKMQICYDNEGLFYILACPCRKKIYSKVCFCLI
jgi:hypothetical protein